MFYFQVSWRYKALIAFDIALSNGVACHVYIYWWDIQNNNLSTLLFCKSHQYMYTWRDIQNHNRTQKSIKTMKKYIQSYLAQFLGFASKHICCTQQPRP